jgi:hypothetical protein
MYTPFPLRRLAVLLAFCAASAHATPLMEVRADQLLFAANELKSSLALTPNQLTLWQQVSAKASGILRARQQRREHLHMTVKEKLADPAVELRDVGHAVDAEADLSAGEDKQLRELWLSVTDALSDQQRAKVSAELLSILERVDAPDRPQHGGREGGAPPGGMRGKRSGGMGGGGHGGGLD